MLSVPIGRPLSGSVNVTGLPLAGRMALEPATLKPVMVEVVPGAVLALSSRSPVIV